MIVLLTFGAGQTCDSAADFFCDCRVSPAAAFCWCALYIVPVAAIVEAAIYERPISARLRRDQRLDSLRSIMRRSMLSLWSMRAAMGAKESGVMLVRCIWGVQREC